MPTTPDWTQTHEAGLADGADDKRVGRPALAAAELLAGGYSPSYTAGYDEGVGRVLGAPLSVILPEFAGILYDEEPVNVEPSDPFARWAGQGTYGV